MKRQLTDLQLERYLADALSLEERAAVEKALSHSNADVAALHALRASTEALFIALPPAAFAHRLSPVSKPLWKGWFGALGVAVAAAAVFFLALPKPTPELSIKGASGWHVTASLPARTLSSHAFINTGETLRFQITSDRPLYVAVISHAPDGWWVYAPAKGETAARVEPGLTVLGDGAQLDDSVGEETLYLVSSDSLFEPAQAKDALEKSLKPPGLTFEVIPLIKRRP